MEKAWGGFRPHEELSLALTVAGVALIRIRLGEFVIPHNSSGPTVCGSKLDCFKAAARTRLYGITRLQLKNNLAAPRGGRSGISTLIEPGCSGGARHASGPALSARRRLARAPKRRRASVSGERAGVSTAISWCSTTRAVRRVRTRSVAAGGDRARTGHGVAGPQARPG
jgi:hypothetical protein